MDSIPVRRSVARPYRAVFSAIEKWVTLPDISPSYYHAFAIVASILFIYAQAPWLKILILGLVLVADWLDGATARRYHKCCRAGYMTDVVTDRLSEGFIFGSIAGTTLGQIFFLLWLANLALAYYSLHSNKHTALPLRCAYLIILIAQAVAIAP
jgi:phosphatidylglycerophosphate synthase